MTKRFYSLKEASEYLCMKPSTLYKKVGKNAEIPYYKRNNRVLFDIVDLDQYMDKKRRKSIEEIELQAQRYIAEEKRNKIQGGKK